MTTKEIEIFDKNNVNIIKAIDTAATYSFSGEDHTFGNILRSMLIKE